MHPGILSASRGSLSYSRLISPMQSLTHLSMESNLANISNRAHHDHIKLPRSTRMGAVGTRKIKHRAKPSDARDSSAKEMRKARRDIRNGKVRKATKVAFPGGTHLGGR